MISFFRIVEKEIPETLYEETFGLPQEQNPDRFWWEPVPDHVLHNQTCAESSYLLLCLFDCSQPPGLKEAPKCPQSVRQGWAEQGFWGGKNRGRASAAVQFAMFQEL